MVSVCQRADGELGAEGGNRFSVFDGVMEGGGGLNP